jgi:hypothetical protein
MPGAARDMYSATGAGVEDTDTKRSYKIETQIEKRTVNLRQAPNDPTHQRTVPTTGSLFVTRESPGWHCNPEEPQIATLCIQEELNK